jgi:hypothetical protein
MAEALACGTPVIACPCGAAPEIVDDGVTGFLGVEQGVLVRAVRRVGRREAALALGVGVHYPDGAKEPVDSVTSNMGHCLWCGILNEDKAARVAELLAGPTLNNGFGLRTLATDMGGYNPMSYHSGWCGRTTARSRWPGCCATASSRGRGGAVGGRGRALMFLEIGAPELTGRTGP